MSTKSAPGSGSPSPRTTPSSGALASRPARPMSCASMRSSATPRHAVPFDVSKKPHEHLSDMSVPMAMTVDVKIAHHGAMCWSALAKCSCRSSSLESPW